MRLTTTLLSLLLSLPFHVYGESIPSPVPPKPCQIRSPSTGSFFDLRPLELHPKPLPSPTATRSASGTASTATTSTSPLPKPESYHSRGYDYPANFTLNICGAVVEPLLDVEGVPKSRWANISAYYKDSDGSIQSLGQQNAHPIFRGRKLLLNYTQGSPCPDLDEDGRPLDTLSNVTSITAKKTNRYKSTLLTFTCDTSPSLTNHPVVSFLGSPDHCTYVFEVRSRYACAGATGPPADSNSLSPTGVFFVILAIAVMVYLVGGCVYQRSVMHQRGWRQCPNFGVWAGIFGFVGDTFTILTSSLAHCLHLPSLDRLFNANSNSNRLPSSRSRSFFGRGRGYTSVSADDGDEEYNERAGGGRGGGSGGRGGERRTGSGGAGGTGRGKRSDEDEENRLIDSLNEEWE